MLGIYSWAHLPGKDDGRVGFKDAGLRPEVKRRIRSYLELIVISSIMIWTGLSLFFGGVHKRSANAHNIKLYVVDLDHGEVGANVTQIVMNMERTSTVPSWLTNDDFATFEDVRSWVLNKSWGALVINAGTSDRLQKALTEGTDYDSTMALTVLESSGKNIIGEMLFAQSALSSAASQACLQFAMNLVGSLKLNSTSAEEQAQINFDALINPLAYTTVDVAPEDFVLAPVLMTFGFLCCLLCAVGVLILWRMTTFVFFLKVRFRDLALMWYFLILCFSLIVPLYLSFAILAFRGPNYNSLALPYTPATFFKIWFTAAAVMCALMLWLFSLFQFMPPHLLAFPSICTIIPNVVSTVAPVELAPKFYRIMYALPFFNGSRIIHYVISGGSPTLRLNIGVLAAEMAFMAICLGIAIWIRQIFVIRGISDPQGWYRGSLYFNTPVPYYKANPATTEKKTGNDPEQGIPASSSGIPPQQAVQSTTTYHSSQLPSGSTLSANDYSRGAVRNRPSALDIADENADSVSLTTGNLGG
ncbi:hypothetical protein EV175_005988 [Coemansia sp. RSA 1933]|nr:hypothetical protein EV175_005988 [Coemansia sp. RSA 1933]